jgi:hypothetical protein
VPFAFWHWGGMDEIELSSLEVKKCVAGGVVWSSKVKASTFASHVQSQTYMVAVNRGLESTQARICDCAALP